MDHIHSASLRTMFPPPASWKKKNGALQRLLCQTVRSPARNAVRSFWVVPDRTGALAGARARSLRVQPKPLGRQGPFTHHKKQKVAG